VLWPAAALREIVQHYPPSVPPMMRSLRWRDFRLSSHLSRTASTASARSSLGVAKQRKRWAASLAVSSKSGASCRHAIAAHLAPLRSLGAITVAAHSNPKYKRPLVCWLLYRCPNEKAAKKARRHALKGGNERSYPRRVVSRAPAAAAATAIVNRAPMCCSAPRWSHSRFPRRRPMRRQWMFEPLARAGRFCLRGGTRTRGPALPCAVMQRRRWQLMLRHVASQLLIGFRPLQ
jgi:hypothetical protein